MTEPDPPRILVCGSRRWPWPDTVTQVLDSLLERHGEQLVIIEGAATGADRAAHRWCEQHRLPAWRHRCYPAWAAERRRRPRSWQWAGPERNQRMLLAEEPRLGIAFHENFTPTTGGTSDTCLRALLLDIPVWLTQTAEPRAGLWLHLDHFPPARAAQMRAQLARARRQPGIADEGA